MASMKAAVWKGLERVEVDEVPVPEPVGSRDVQIRVAACGVCGTDVHLLENKFPLFKPPRIIGHEYTGVVSAVGSEVTRVRVGDRVAAESGIACDRCYFCRDGREHLCSNRFVHPGGFAEYTCITERQVHKLPDEVSFEVGSLAEPVACALRAMDMLHVRSGDVALVQGGGTIGCLFTQLLLHGGIAKVIVSEPVPHRREVVKAVGGIPVDPRGEDLAAVVARETDGLGPEYVFDCVGHPALLEQGIELVQRGGTVFVMGVADPQAVARVRPYQIFDKELRITSSYMRPYTFHRAVRWLPQLTLGPLLGLEYPLARTQEAIQALRQGKGLKIIVKP
jgi:2-desacetyl-2-hydroxyethyl bacteriochlorophyllide A dehydrogenase